VNYGVLEQLHLALAGEVCLDAGVADRGIDRLVTHDQALQALRTTLEAAPAPVSIAVVDDHGELVACLAMDGAARDTLENARRKAYTAARSDATSTRALAEKVQGAPTELASFDPQFSFFHGGVAALSGGRHVGAVGVSGLRGRTTSGSRWRRSSRRDSSREADATRAGDVAPGHSRTRKLRCTNGPPGSEAS
jgi:uncharacterized protein GlcG (DUF336 family)